MEFHGLSTLLAPDRLRDARCTPPVVPEACTAGRFSRLPDELIVSVLSCRVLGAIDILHMRKSCLALYSVTHEASFTPVLIEASLRTRVSLRTTAMAHGPEPLRVLRFLEQFPQCASCSAWSKGLQLTAGCCKHCYGLGRRAEARAIRPQPRAALVAFAESPRFDGARPGWKFTSTTTARGVGYYRDGGSEAP